MSQIRLAVHIQAKLKVDTGHRLALHQENQTGNISHCFVLKKYILSLLSFNRGLQGPESFTKQIQTAKQSKFHIPLVKYFNKWYLCFIYFEEG